MKKSCLLLSTSILLLLTLALVLVAYLGGPRVMNELLYVVGRPIGIVYSDSDIKMAAVMDEIRTHIYCETKNGTFYLFSVQSNYRSMVDVQKSRDGKVLFFLKNKKEQEEPNVFAAWDVASNSWLTSPYPETESNKVEDLLSKHGTIDIVVFNKKLMEDAFKNQRWIGYFRTKKYLSIMESDGGIRMPGMN